jgi:hypothetical protein
MLVAVPLAFAVCFLFVAIGAFAARYLLADVRGPAKLHATPALGIAATLAILELAGTFLPIRVAVWFLAPFALLGSWVLASSAKSFRWHAVREACLPVLAAFGVGLVPLFAAGRATAAALTNDDATYYITAADRLLEAPWIELESLPEGCVRDRVLHVWNWRTGISNLMAAIESVAHRGIPASIGFLTPALFVCLPGTAALLALALGAPNRASVRLGVGLVSALSAASTFLGYQHLTGQLAAFIFFPLSAIAVARAMSRGGVRSILVATLFLGSAVAIFADGGAVLLVTLLGVSIAPRKRHRRALGRLIAVIGATVLGFPATIARALMAAYGTVANRMPSPRPIFPQRGWLERSLFSDAATALGLDPWPPWPLPSPINPAAVLEIAAVLAGLFLLFSAARRSRRRRSAALVAVLLLAAVGVAETSQKPYLIGKSLLMLAAFVVPIAALGLSIARGMERAAALVYAVGVVAALLQLARADRFLVVDTPDHDRLVPELAALPKGSLLVLDGFGAPTDRVHDEHRAYRAALLAHLQPIQPGLDGGFYRPLRCADPPPFFDVPLRAFALQRRGSETLSFGRDRAAFGPFTVREIDFGLRDAILGAWAPTTGWLAAETEPNGNVFRWGGATLEAELFFLQSEPCARLRAEVRSLERTGQLEIDIKGERIHTGAIGPTWTELVTSPLVAGIKNTVAFHAIGFEGVRDPARVLAFRNPQVLPTSECTRTLRRLGRLDPEPALPEDLVSSRAYEVVPAAGMSCAIISARVETEGEGRLGLRAGREERWSTIAPPGGEAVTGVVDVQRVREIDVLAETGPSAPVFRVTALRARPAPCDGPSHK